jgi:hypothetical protein
MTFPEAGDPAPLLHYEIPSESPRARWVYLVVVLYLLVLAALFLIPTFAAFSQGTDLSFVLFLSIYISVLTICGLSLLILPVRAVRRRPISRRSIWFPIIGAGLLAGTLVFGAGIAIHELLKAGDAFAWAILFASLGVWVGWSNLFALIAIRSGPERIGGKLHKLLIAGSVLELLVAVPSNVIVRRRTECCAGFETGMGICIGVSIMIISLGPSVLILYHKRRKQILPPKGLRRI